VPPFRPKVSFPLPQILWRRLPASAQLSYQSGSTGRVTEPSRMS
jgi:hypothetical protein